RQQCPIAVCEPEFDSIVHKLEIGEHANELSRSQFLLYKTYYRPDADSETPQHHFPCHSTSDSATLRAILPSKLPGAGRLQSPRSMLRSANTSCRSVSSAYLPATCSPGRRKPRRHRDSISLAMVRSTARRGVHPDVGSEPDTGRSPA